MTTTWTPPRHGTACARHYGGHLSRNPHAYIYAPVPDWFDYGTTRHPERGDRSRAWRAQWARSRTSRVQQLAQKQTRWGITVFGLPGNGTTLRPGPREITKFRKVLKEASKAGGRFHVDVDMRPTDGRDARALLALAAGRDRRQVEEWHRSGISRARGHYSHRSYRDPMEADSQGYVADPAYEARMTAWAARFLPAEEVMAA